MSADESAEWDGEETKNSASDEEAETAGGAGEAKRLLTVTAGEMEGSGAKDSPGGAVASGGITTDVTSEDVDTTGPVGRNGAENRERKNVSGWRENPADESSGVGTTEGGPKASGLAGNPRGGCHGVGGGVELLQGINTPGVEELPQGDENPGVTT